MSTQRGNVARTRTQKHKNRTAFKNDMHDKTPQQLRLNAMHVSEVCQHCKAVIEWKIKYRKYKPLPKPKTCVRCQQRNIRKAYHVLCRDCSLAGRVCAKCLKSADEVDIEPPKPTPEEEQKLKVEMERLIRSFPERKRRAFQRYMDKGKKQEVGSEENIKESTEANNDNATSDVATDVPKQQRQRVPHSRDELLQKIEQLKLREDDDEDDQDFDSDSDSDSDGFSRSEDDTSNADDENTSS